MSFKYLEGDIPKFSSNPNDKTLLTDKGFQQVTHAGHLVGRQYRDFIRTMTPANVSVRSTNYQRSYYSANAFYKGVLKGADVEGDMQRCFAAADKVDFFLNESSKLRESYLVVAYKNFIKNHEEDKKYVEQLAL